MTLARFHFPLATPDSTIKTMSSTLNCRALLAHFVLRINVWKYSRWNRFQNCCTNDWMYSNLFRQFLVSRNGPCGMSADARPRIRWFGVKGRRSFGSLEGYPRGRLFTRLLTSANTVDISFHDNTCCPTITRNAFFVSLITFEESSLMRTQWCVESPLDFMNYSEVFDFLFSFL